MPVKIKYLIFQYYLFLIVAILIVVGTLLYLFWRQLGTPETLFAIFGGIISFFYFAQKQQLEELTAFKEIFTEFNGRYDQLNEKLNRIVADEKKDALGKGEIDTLYDYFNLCGEEYLFYRRGYIYPEVWQSWSNGMAYFLAEPRIEALWAEEEKESSYYGLTRKVINKSAKRRKNALNR